MERVIHLIFPVPNENKYDSIKVTSYLDVRGYRFDRENDYSGILTIFTSDNKEGYEMHCHIDSYRAFYNFYAYYATEPISIYRAEILAKIHVKKIYPNIVMPLANLILNAGDVGVIFIGH